MRNPFVKTPKPAVRYYGKIKVYPGYREIGYFEDEKVSGASPAEVLDLLVTEAVKIQARAEKAYQAMGLPVDSKLYVSLEYPRLENGGDCGSGGSTSVDNIASTVSHSRSLEVYYYQTDQHRRNPEQIAHPSESKNVYRQSHLPWEMEPSDMASYEASAVAWMNNIHN